MVPDKVKVYLKKHFSVDEILAHEDPIEEELSFNAQKSGKRMHILLQILRLLPWICGLGFVASFLWDFTAEYQVMLFGNSISFAGIIKTVCVSGLIGYGTNYIAIKMLFRPIQRRPIWGQGLIPAQRDRIIHALARGIHKHILSQELIKKRLAESGFIARINQLLIQGATGLIQDTHLRNEIKQALHERLKSYFLREDIRRDIREIVDSRLQENMDKGLKGVLLKTYKRYNKEDYQEVIDKLVLSIPATAMQAVEKLEPEIDQLADILIERQHVTEQFITNTFIEILDTVDIPRILRKQMAHFDEARLEKMIWEATNEQLLYIQYLGTFLGILGGLLIWQPVVMGAFYIVLLSTLFGIDNLLFKARQITEESQNTQQTKQPKQEAIQELKEDTPNTEDQKPETDELDTEGKLEKVE